MNKENISEKYIKNTKLKSLIYNSIHNIFIMLAILEKFSLNFLQIIGIKIFFMLPMNLRINFKNISCIG